MKNKTLVKAEMYAFFNALSWRDAPDPSAFVLENLENCFFHLIKKKLVNPQYKEVFLQAAHLAFIRSQN